MEQSVWRKAGETDKLSQNALRSRQLCHVGDKTNECKLGWFEDADVARVLADPQSTSGGMLCIFGDHTLVPHSNTEAGVISLDTGLRMKELLALTLWVVLWLT